MKFIADENDENVRLDVYLTNLIENLSRSRIQNAIQNGEIMVDRELKKPSHKLKEGEVIEFEPLVLAEEIKIQPQNIDLNIIYEDENMLVVNKPSGMLTHPTTIEKENTLVNALKFKYGENLSDINGEFRRGILHRLDRNTSGLLMIAKNNKTHRFLAEQIKEKTAIRSYLAVVQGIVKDNGGVINLPIGRNPSQPKKMAVIEDGKPSITEYKVLERFDNATLVELTLKTGRTHQIRVHMSYTGTPVFNDTLYGAKCQKIKTQEQVLQAYKLQFTKPFSDEIIKLEIEPSEKIQKVLKFLRSQK